MIQLISTAEESILQEKVGSHMMARFHDSRNFFTVLSEQTYFLIFRCLDDMKTAVYATCDELIIMTESPSVRKCADNIDVSDNGLHQLVELFLELTANDVYRLESLENMIITLEDHLLMNKRPSKDGIQDIIKVRKDLLKVKRYYEQMEFLSDELAAVDPSFRFIDKKFDRLMDFVLHLQEYIEQVREAYQSQIDIEQNNIMKVFTVVTSIFLPLTLIAGWYGMNLQMPEYEWSWGYPLVIGISLAVIAIMIVVFKRKKWF